MSEAIRKRVNRLPFMYLVEATGAMRIEQESRLVMDVFWCTRRDPRPTVAPSEWPMKV